MLWPGLSSTFYDQIAFWVYVEEIVTYLAMPGIAKAHLTWNSVKGMLGAFLLRPECELDHPDLKRVTRGTTPNPKIMDRENWVAEVPSIARTEREKNG